MIRALLAIALLPLTACVSYETDPAKIPDPVKPRELATEPVVARPATSTSTSTTTDSAPQTAVIATHSGRASEQGAESPNPERTPAQVTRVGGDTKAQIEIRDGEFRFGPSRIESPLPAGYPEPTPPGAIDLKKYPAVRRAEYASSGSPGIGMNMGFFPLFSHIKSQDIAMTSPVEMDYRDMFDPTTGQRVQKGSTSTMIFGVAHVIHYMSQFMVLEPGDLITTGTPPGVGAGFKPPRFLKAGDRMRVGIEGLGEQTQNVVAWR